MNLKQIVDVLHTDAARSRVLADAAHFDFFCGVALCIYFSPGERSIDLLDLVVDRLSFDAKLSALERLRLSRPYVSRKALPVMRHIQQARNFVAHEWFVWDGHRKLQHANWLYLFEDYPASYDAAVTPAKQRLRRLSGTKEFLGHQSS